MSKLDKLIEDFKSEENQNTPPAEPTPQEPTPAPAEEPKPEEPKPEDKPAEPNPVEPSPAEEPKPEEPKPEDKPQFQSRQEHAFKRQLAKQREKYEADLKERDGKIAELTRQMAEINKKVNPEVVKTRDAFQTDDDYIRYLADLQVKRIMEERDAESAKKAEEEAANRKKQEEEAEELRQRQQEWNANVDATFGEDKQRKEAFLKRVDFCVKRGLGEILDAVPVAADFLMNQPNGVLVFEKLLSDKSAFERVFNAKTNPMEIYAELRDIRKEILSASPAPAPTPAPAKPVPHIGRPGKQAGENTAPDIFSDPRAMKEFLRTH